MTPELVVKLIDTALVAVVLFYVVVRFESGAFQSGRVVDQSRAEALAQTEKLIQEIRTQNRELIVAMRAQSATETEALAVRIVSAIEARLDEHQRITQEQHATILRELAVREREHALKAARR